MELDTSCFKAFKHAAQTLNFTEAAKLANMTQSGVSNHIAKLEKDLGAKLFLRIGKRVQLSNSGRELLAFVERFEDQVRSLHDSVQGEEGSLSGLVRYAMPESCLLSPHFAMLLKAKAHAFPDVDLQVTIHHSEMVLESLLAHESDFGFVTKCIPHPEIHYEPFCEEEYALAVPANATKKFYEQAGWIMYPGFDDISEKWRSKQSKRDKTPASIDLTKDRTLKGRSNSLRAALTMVAHGLGITIAPRHCMDAVEDRRLLKATTDGFRPAMNQIYIATLKRNSLPARVNKTIETFRAMK